jgi:hypothetical protein
MTRAAAGRNLISGWRHAGRAGQAAAAGLALTCAAAAGVGLAPATAGAAAALAGLPVPPGLLPAISTAAQSCPELTGPRLAGQLMTASRFNPHATAPGGRSGIAGLTTAQWQQWAPAPGTPRSDTAANITALAHDMCDLAGQARAAAIPGNTWSLALAAFRSGLPAITAAREIPAQLTTTTCRGTPAQLWTLP